MHATIALSRPAVRRPTIRRFARIDSRESIRTKKLFSWPDSQKSRLRSDSHSDSRNSRPALASTTYHLLGTICYYLLQLTSTYYCLVIPTFYLLSTYSYLPTTTCYYLRLLGQGTLSLRIHLVPVSGVKRDIWWVDEHWSECQEGGVASVVEGSAFWGCPDYQSRA